MSLPHLGRKLEYQRKDTVDSLLWLLPSRVSQALDLEISTVNLANVLTHQAFAEPIPLGRGETRDWCQAQVKDPGGVHSLVLPRAPLCSLVLPRAPSSSLVLSF